MTKKKDYLTFFLFFLLHFSIALVYLIFDPLIQIGEYSYLGIALFPLSLFLIFNPIIDTKNWLVSYTAIILLFLYTIGWIYAIISNFAWYYRALAILMVLPVPFYLPKYIKNLYLDIIQSSNKRSKPLANI